MLEQSLQYFAKGGCFLAGTFVSTPDGDVPIEELKVGDKVISFNEKTKKENTSKVGSIDILQRDHYYLINNAVAVTAEHPFYTERGIVKVQDLEIGDQLVVRGKALAEVGTLVRVDEEVTVYNLLDVSPNNNYYAANFLVHNKGGGCFLAGTAIQTSLKNTEMATAYTDIEELKAGDKVVSLNERTNKNELSKVERIDKLVAESYYILNDNVKATGEHPFYTENGIVKVADLKIGDVLQTQFGDELLHTIQYVEEDVVIYNLINVTPNSNYYADGYLVHNKGGGGARASSGSTSRSTSGTSSKSTTSTPSKPAAPKPGVSKATPGSKVKTADGKEVTSSTKKPASTKHTNSKGIVGDNGYAPRYVNGYTPPAGSVVYRENNSALDYLPWIYLFSVMGDSPRNDQEVIVQPDGKEVQAKPVPQGVDGLLILNWIILIIIVGAIIGGIVWLVNKYTSKGKTPPVARSYSGW